jgi:N-acetylmuramoyl-L-alanine amidase
MLSSAIAWFALNLVVIDPGHGGTQPGAVARDGTQEKDICLEVGLRLARHLQAKSKARVVLTRRSDRTLTLKQRAEMANRLKATVFVSIHANASRRVGASGFETYFMSNSASDRRAQLLAAKENYEVLESSAAAPSGDLETILKDADSGRIMSESARLARLTQQHMLSEIGGTDRSVRQAPFAVLVRSGAAAILVEVGFLTNPVDLRRLKMPAYQDKLAAAIAAAVIDYGNGIQPEP